MGLFDILWTNEHLLENRGDLRLQAELIKRRCRNQEEAISWVQKYAAIFRRHWEEAVNIISKEE